MKGGPRPEVSANLRCIDYCNDRYELYPSDTGKDLSKVILSGIEH